MADDFAIMKDVASGDYVFQSYGDDVTPSEFLEDVECAILDASCEGPSGVPEAFRLVREMTFVGSSVADVLGQASRCPGLSGIVGGDEAATGLTLDHADGSVRLYVTSPYYESDIEGPAEF